MILNELQNLGFILPKNIKNAPKINRCKTIHSGNNINGWFIMYDNYCVYGDWAGHIEKGTLRDGDRAPISKNDYKLNYQQDLIERAEKLRLLNIDYNGFCYLGDDKHPYLIKKQVQSHKLLKINNGELLIPIGDFGGNFMGYQRITTRYKLFGYGTQKHGNFFAIRTNVPENKTIFIAEGYATAMSVFMATNHTTVCAFDGGNIDTVVTTLVNNGIKLSRIIAIKDNDDAGRKVQAHGIFIGDNHNDDANDYHVKHGLDALRKKIFESI